MKLKHSFNNFSVKTDFPWDETENMIHEIHKPPLSVLSTTLVPQFKEAINQLLHKPL